MRVINITNFPPPQNCHCHNWLEHWIQYNGSPPRYCAVKNCFEPAEIGGCVEKNISWDDDYYIVPLCEKHHQEYSELELCPTIKLAPIDPLTTCSC